MPSRPGVAVSLLDTPTTLSVPSDTGTWFAAGTTDRGPSNVAVLIQSLDQFVTVYGARQTYSVLYDALETFFREGGNRVYVSRVVGPAPTSGFKNLLDAGAGTSLIVTAIGPGAWSSSYKVGVVAGGVGGTYQIQISDAANNILEQSSDLADQASAIAWSQYSNYVRITLGATALNPAVAALAALSAGADDRTNIVDAQWANALALFLPAYGPGQVSAPGRTSAVAQSQLKAHAEANNRVFILDLPDSPTVGTLTAAAATVTSRFGAAFGPWVVIPGLTNGTTRTVPPSAFIAGLIARNDPSYGTNQPSAGKWGAAQFVYDISQPEFTDPQRTTLNTANCNMIRRMSNGIRNYGWRSLANAITDSGWVDFGNARLEMDLVSELNAVAENYMFSTIDGQNGDTINDFHGTLAGVLLDHFIAGELFGDTADQAFAVDTGAAVNTLATIANNELHAVCRVRMAPFAEYIVIQIVKRLVTQTV